MADGRAVEGGEGWLISVSRGNDIVSREAGLIDDSVFLVCFS